MTLSTTKVGRFARAFLSKFFGKTTCFARAKPTLSVDGKLKLPSTRAYEVFRGFQLAMATQKAKIKA